MNTLTSVRVNGKTVKVSSTRDIAIATNIAKLVKAREAEAKAKAEALNATEALSELLGKGKHVVPGFGEVTVSENNTYSDAKMLAALRPGQQRLVTKRVLDRAKVKSMYPSIYEAAKTPGGYKASGRLY